LREIIEQQADLEVVAACRCAEGAMLAVRQYRPAIIVLDVRLPDRDGFELVRDITATSETKVIVFTAAFAQKRLTPMVSGGSPLACASGRGLP